MYNVLHFARDISVTSHSYFIDRTDYSTNESDIEGGAQNVKQKRQTSSSVPTENGIGVQALLKNLYMTNNNILQIDDPNKKGQK